MFEPFKIIAMVVAFLITAYRILFIYLYFRKREKEGKREFIKDFYIVPKLTTFSLFALAFCFFALQYKDKEVFYIGFVAWGILFVLTQKFFSRGKRKEAINCLT